MAYEDLPRLCPSCRWNVEVRTTVAGEFKIGRGCTEHVSSFPEARTCVFYERVPGADDEG